MSTRKPVGEINKQGKPVGEIIKQGEPAEESVKNTIMGMVGNSSRVVTNTEEESVKNIIRGMVGDRRILSPTPSKGCWGPSMSRGQKITLLPEDLGQSLACPPRVL
jgi:hypothetical protein